MPRNSAAADKLFPWLVYLNLLLAIISYAILWLLPSAVCIGMWRLLASLWDIPLETTARWGLWWPLGYGVVSGLFVLSALLVPLLFVWTYKMWRTAPQMAPAPPGVPLYEHDAPELFAFAEAVRRETTIGRPVEIWCDLPPATGNIVYRAPGSRDRRRALIVGLSAVSELSVTDLKTLMRLNLAALSLSGVTRFTLSLHNRARFNYFIVTLQLCRRVFVSAELYAIRFASRNGADARSAMEALQKVAAEFQKFWMIHGQMMLQTRHIIPVVEGFREHCNRASAIKSLGDGSALPLLASPSVVEARLVRAIVQSNPGIEAVSWDQAAIVLLDSWKEFVDTKAPALNGVRVKDLHDLDFPQLAREIFHQPGRLYDRNQLRLMAGHFLATAVAVALSRAGWKFSYSGPAAPMEFSKDGRVIEPFALLAGVVNGSVDDAAWRAACSDAGIGEVLLNHTS